MSLDLSPALQDAVDRIDREMRAMSGLVIGFSGGVDSSTVAALAHRALGEQAVAVTAVSETLPDRELADARRVAAEIGIRHREIAFSELADDRFRENAPSRCYFCQSMRFEHLREIAEFMGEAVVASGTNASDEGDHRPGLQAMREQGIYQPLLTHGLEKTDVRRVARALDLSIWNKPAQACLSSRIPHGLEVTNERLRRIEAAEDVLDDLQFRQFRVRDHEGLARVEIGTDEQHRILQPELLRTIRDRLRDCGFKAITVDLGGYVSGSLNPAGPAPAASPPTTA